MKRLLTGLMAMALGVSPAMAAADGGGTGAETNAAAANTAKPEDSAKSASAAKPESTSVDLQLGQLRSLLEAQAEELKAQHAALLEQQKRMAGLEEQLRAARAASSATPGMHASTSPEADAEVASLGATVSGLKASNEAPAATVASGAKQAKEKLEEKLSDLANGKIKIGGTFFADYAYYTDTGFGPQFLTQLNQDGPGNRGFNSFDITRAYINFLYTPNDAVTLRLTPNVYRQVDVAGAIANGKNSAIASSSNGNLGFRLKYAYVDFNTLFKGSDTFKKDKLTVGQTTNPLVDWEEALYGYRYVNLVPWNYLSLSSTYTGITLHGPIEFNGKEYLDYHIGVFNTASFHSIETNDKKQGMVRLTWYPLGTSSDRTGFGVTGFEDYGYNTKTPDAISTPLNRLAVLVHYQSHSKAYLLAGEYDLGRNAFSTGNLFSGAGPADIIIPPTPPATPSTTSQLYSALLAGNRTRQQGFSFFGHMKLGHTPFSLFGMFHYFQPNTHISGTNPLDFERTVGGISYKYNDHFEFSVNDQNLNYFHSQFTMSQAQIMTFSPSLATTVGAGGIPNVVPKGTNAIFINLLFNY